MCLSAKAERAKMNKIRLQKTQATIKGTFRVPRLWTTSEGNEGHAGGQRENGPKRLGGDKMRLPLS